MLNTETGESQPIPSMSQLDHAHTAKLARFGNMASNTAQVAAE